jgi:vacuolar-type H+-ATPase subunit F/Vma7
VKIVAVGRADDTRGFALAGVEIVSCRTPGEADAVISALSADAHVGVVIVPAWLNRVAPALVARVRARRRGPVLIVLPDAEPESGG